MMDNASALPTCPQRQHQQQPVDRNWLIFTHSIPRRASFSIRIGRPFMRRSLPERTRQGPLIILLAYPRRRARETRMRSFRISEPRSRKRVHTPQLCFGSERARRALQMPRSSGPRTPYDPKRMCSAPCPPCSLCCLRASSVMRPIRPPPLCKCIAVSIRDRADRSSQAIAGELRGWEILFGGVQHARLRFVLTGQCHSCHPGRSDAGISAHSARRAAQRLFDPLGSSCRPRRPSGCEVAERD